MQQIKSYWRVGTLAAVAGLITAFVGSACTVTTTTDEAGAAGTDLTAGANTAGTVAVAGADTAGGAGGAAAGTTSAAGTGGDGKVPYSCTPDSGDVLGTPNSCTPAAGSETDKCALCVQAKCCTEYSNCYATSPGNQCGWGGPNDMGEITCIQTCIQAGFQKTEVYDDSLVSTCSNSDCATNSNNGSSMACGQFIGQQTNDLVACLNTNCQGPCFTGEAN